MKKPITLKILLGAAALSIAASNVGLAQNSPQNAPQAAQWNALFDRIIRLEQNVKGLAAKSLAANGGGASADFARTQSNEQFRQLLNEVRQMRQQLLGMDARLRRLEARADRSGAVVPNAPPPRQQAQFPADNQTFIETDINRFAVNQEPQIFVEIGEPKQLTTLPPPAPQVTRQVAPQTASQAAPVQPVRPVPSVIPFAQASRPTESWQNPAPVRQDNTRVAALPPQNNAALVPGGVERQTLDGAQVSTGALAKKLYDNSRTALRARRYGAAESGFKSFLRKYRKNRLAPNAQFMLGETYYVQKNYRLAAQAYLQGYRRFPKARRSSDTLLKLGMAMAKLGQKSQSCGVYESVVSKYKSSNRAVVRAKKEMKRARC